SRRSFAPSTTTSSSSGRMRRARSAGCWWRSPPNRPRRPTPRTIARPTTCPRPPPCNPRWPRCSARSWSAGWRTGRSRSSSRSSPRGSRASSADHDRAELHLVRLHAAGGAELISQLTRELVRVRAALEELVRERRPGGPTGREVVCGATRAADPDDVEGCILPARRSEISADAFGVVVAVRHLKERRRVLRVHAVEQGLDHAHVLVVAPREPDVRDQPSAGSENAACLAER